MSEQTTALQAQTSETPSSVNVFSAEGFEIGQRIAKALSSSTVVPTDYRNNPGNCMVALEMSYRTNSSVLAIMQNMDIIHGKPSFSSKFLIAQLNQHPRFKGGLKFKFGNEGKKKMSGIVFKDRQPHTVTYEGDNLTCQAWAKTIDGEIIEGEIITIELAVKEGWWHKAGSKWPNMTRTMLQYRAASFFCNLNCPEVSLGMPSTDVLQDIPHEVVEDQVATVVRERKKPAPEPEKEELI